MNRPQLTVHISIEDFRSFYWLKEELIRFCRANGLTTAGSKEELHLRVEALLSPGVTLTDVFISRKQRARGQMPAEFQRDTVIRSGWWCSQALRSFFEEEIGPHFHFNGFMRDYVEHGAGKTLEEAMAAWKADRRIPKAAKEIGIQFEYNQHIREYFQEHHGATLDQAIQAWKTKRAKRRE